MKLIDQILIITDNAEKLKNKNICEYDININKNQTLVIKDIHDNDFDEYCKNELFLATEIYLISTDINNKIQIKLPTIYKQEEFKNQQIQKYIIDKKLLVGKRVSENYVKQIKKIIDHNQAILSNLTLCIVQVGNNDASNIYIRNKINLAKRLNLNVELLKFDENINEQELSYQIKLLNENEKIRGILLQLPLPKHLDSQKFLNLISHNKDVDCFNVINLGELVQNNQINNVFPCTPKGIICLLKSYQINFVNKHVVVIGRSNIVGKPVALMALSEDATITICHSKTQNLREIVKQGDIVISAVGKAKLIDDNDLKEGAIVIDVGMNRDMNNHLCGDVDFNSVHKKVKFISPVPYGVGPMTLIMLVDNFLNLCNIQKDFDLFD